MARSLLTFLSVGLVSGLALGIYLVDVKEMLYTGTASLYLVEGPSISVVPTNPTYDEGERVVFRIINTGTVPLHSNDHNFYGATVSGLSGIVFYRFDIIDVVSQNDTMYGSNMSFDESAHFANSDAVQYDDNDYDSMVFGDDAYSLLPGHEIFLSWDQTKHDGELVQPGLYKINVQALGGDDDGSYYNSNNNNTDDSLQTTIVTDSVTFTIR